MAKGLLLVNLGTPDSTKTKDVRKYLRQFLSDPRVLDIPGFFRFLLLNLVILPTRPRKSAEAYKEIWTEQGSPLLINTKQLTDKVSKYLPDWHVVHCMRYGNPSIAAAIKSMQKEKVSSVYVLPLFPQYASSSYGSALAEVYSELQKHDYVIPVHVQAPYYDDPSYIDILSDHSQSSLEGYDYVLMSFHGLPERHVVKSDGGTLPKGCDLRGPCPKVTKRNYSCYRAQCYATANAIAKKLGLVNFGVAFQSRLGKTPWIKPYTDEYLQQIYNQGFRKLAVMCPSFTADCLETLEEIGMGLQEQWLEMGGEALSLVPCLNDNNNWAELISDWAKKSQS